jgi:anti-anti-sigma factor
MPAAPRRIVCHLHELVRGEETNFVEEVAAQLRLHSVELDLSAVDRIDAAGIAALLSLYAQAHHLGRSLTIVALSRHVKEILTLVGLEPLLVSHNVINAPQSGPRLQTVAA